MKFEFNQGGDEVVIMIYHRLILDNEQGPGHGSYLRIRKFLTKHLFELFISNIRDAAPNKESFDHLTTDNGLIGAKDAK